MGCYTKTLCAFFLIFVLVSFSWEPMYKSIWIAFFSWKLTFLGNPSISLGQQKGFLLKTGRGTYQRFLWVDGDFSYWVSFLEVVKMPFWDGWAYKAPKTSFFLHDSPFGQGPSNFSLMVWLVFTKSQGLVGSFVSFNHFLFEDFAFHDPFPSEPLLGSLIY